MSLPRRLIVKHFRTFGTFTLMISVQQRTQKRSKKRTKAQHCGTTKCGACISGFLSMSSTWVRQVYIFLSRWSIFTLHSVIKHFYRAMAPRKTGSGHCCASGLAATFWLFIIFLCECAVPTYTGKLGFKYLNSGPVNYLWHRKKPGQSSV